MEALRRKYEVRVWQWIVTWMCMIALMAGAVIGSARYAADQRQQSRRDSAIATYQADVATYQNSLSDRTSCLARATGRQDIGVLLGGIYDKLDPDSLDPTVNELRVQLDEFEKEQTAEQCPPEPLAPRVPPELLSGGG